MIENIFCPNCGNLLIPKKEKRKSELICTNCRYKTPLKKKKEDIIIKEKVKLEKKDQIELIDKKIETLPKTKEECPKCHNREAYFWLVQTRAGDEAETRFFKCTKCNHTWRIYD